MADSSDDHLPHAITISAVNSHPLQDVDLDAVDNAAAATVQPTQKRSKNWVKFEDDDDNDAHHDVDDHGAAGENNNNNKNHKTTTITATIDGEGNATRAVRPLTAAENATATVTTTTTQLTANRLSPIPTALPPPAKKQTSQNPTATTGHINAIARPRTPLERDPEAAAVTPVQRSTISSTSMPDVAPAVLNTESTHVNLNASGRTQQQQQHHSQQHQQQQYQKPKVAHASSPLAAGSSSQQQQQQQQSQQQQHHSNNGTSSMNAMHKTSNVTIPVETVPPMRTIELSTGRIREGFANGDVIVTLLPANTKWPWITPAIFRPELVPEELMAQGLTLTVEDYVNAMETLVNDYRFTVYNICYKRILVCWILFAFTVLLTLLFSGLQGVALFSLGVGWLFLNASAIFVCMWIKLRLSRGLEKCLARVNRQLMKHKILLILDDRGRISCHKVNLCFLYFDATQCVNFLNEFLEQTEQNGGEAIKAGWERKLDIDVNDIVIQGSNPVRLSRKQERGLQLYLRYGSRWGMEALRGLVDVTPLEPGRHCGQFQCPCQYIKDHLQCKPRGYPCSCIAYASDPYLQNRL